jgi:RNA polymerase sigma factor (sigma-70 family)
MTFLIALCNEAISSNETLLKGGGFSIALDHWDAMMRDALLGREDIYRQLLEEMARALRGTVRSALSRAGRGNADAEDVVQEILVAIHMKRASWDQSQPLRPWLNAITRYKLVDCLRRQGLRSMVPIDDVVETLACPEDDMPDRADAQRLIDQLPARDRDILEGMSLGGRSIGETASRLGMQEGAVRVALHRALKKLAALRSKTASEV